MRMLDLNHTQTSAAELVSIGQVGCWHESAFPDGAHCGLVNCSSDQVWIRHRKKADGEAMTLRSLVHSVDL